MDLRPPRPVRPRAGHSSAVIPTSVSQSGVSSPGSVPGKKDAFDQALVEEASIGAASPRRRIAWSSAAHGSTGSDGGGSPTTAATTGGLIPASGIGMEPIVARARLQLSGDGGNNQKSALQQTMQQQCDPTDRPKPPRCERPIIVHHRLAGWALFLYFCATALYYFHIRYTRTLNMGYYGFGILVLAVEITTSTATLGYAWLLTRYTEPNPEPSKLRLPTAAEAEAAAAAAANAAATSAALNATLNATLGFTAGHAGLPPLMRSQAGAVGSSLALPLPPPSWPAPSKTPLPLGGGIGMAGSVAGVRGGTLAGTLGGTLGRMGGTLGRTGGPAMMTTFGRTGGLAILPECELPPSFQLRVLVPCYSESADLVRCTVEAALQAALPAGTTRTVYVCDDWPDKKKVTMVQQLNEEYGDDAVVYVTRKKPRDDSPDDPKPAAPPPAALQMWQRLPWWITAKGRAAHAEAAARGAAKEPNPKSRNLNNCLTNVLYPDYLEYYKAREAAHEPGPHEASRCIPADEVMVVLDADMVPRPDFFVKTLKIMANPGVALCLTPQGFSDVRPEWDIFNNLNLSFWEYMLPGTDAHGYVACTGTNFVLRCHALADCGWFPTYSITEDYTLGMSLKAKGYKARYLSQYLVVGLSPETPRQYFQQRSRWCKGQLQILFSRHCPLFDLSLGFHMQLLYFSVTWNYITNTLAVPVNVLVPFISLFFGVYPLVLNRDFALAATLFYSGSTAITMFCTKLEHVKPVWFCSTSCHLLWFTFTKALWNIGVRNSLLGSTAAFKSTSKTKAADACDRLFFVRAPRLGDMDGHWDHYWIQCSLFISALTAFVGIFQIIDKPYTAQGDIKWYLLLSVCWAVYNMIPPALFVFYCFDTSRERVRLQAFSTAMLWLSLLAGAAGIACTWLVPNDYDLGQVLNVSLQFFEAQRSGKLPRVSNTPWRGSSAVWDSVLLPGGRNHSLIGGWYDDGGMLKLTYSTSFALSLLAWAYSDFRAGFHASGNADFGANTIRWGADYLLRAAAVNVTTAGSTASTPIVIAQVGDIARDRAHWGSPERATLPRPASFVSAARPGTDLVAMASAALAASAVAVAPDSAQVAGVYLSRAVALYALAKSWPKGTYGRFIESGAKVHPSASFYDDLAYAAAWLHSATGQEVYLQEAMAHYSAAAGERHINPNGYAFNYENVLPALHLLLARSGGMGDPGPAAAARDFVATWMGRRAGAEAAGISYTRRSLARVMPSGTLQHTANAAFYTLAAAHAGLLGGHSMLYACWARSQVGYMLGDAGRSYVTGYGAVQPTKTPHKAASCPPPDVSDCTWESAYYTTDPNYHPLRGGLVGGPDGDDSWTDERDMNNPAVTVTLLNSAGFSAAVAGLVDADINMAKCQQGNGWIQTLLLKAHGKPDALGQRWWEGIA